MATNPPRIAVDVGILTGHGFAEVSEEIHAFKRWYRVGPEVVASVFFSRAVSVGFGLGYQIGYYTGASTTLRRHEISSRVVVRYHFLADAAVEHAVALGLGVTTSLSGPLEPSFRSYETYVKPRARTAPFLSYWPSFRLSEHTRLGIELSVAYYPEPLTFEGILRVGADYRF
jgi:hypothetical protein